MLLQALWIFFKQEVRSVELGVCPMQLFFIFDHVTFIQFKICWCVQNFIEIGWFFAEIWRYNDFQKWRPSVILELFYHRTRPPTKSLLLAAAAYQISCQSVTQIWRYSYLNFSHVWLEMHTHTHTQVNLYSIHALHSIGQTKMCQSASKHAILKQI